MSTCRPNPELEWRKATRSELEGLGYFAEEIACLPAHEVADLLGSIVMGWSVSERHREVLCELPPPPSARRLDPQRIEPHELAVERARRSLSRMLRAAGWAPRWP